MNWQTATFISITAGIFWNLAMRSYSVTSKAPKTYPYAASYLLGVMPIGLVAGLLVFPHHINWSWWVVYLVLIQGIVMAISTWTSFIVSGKISVAPMQTINRISQIAVILLGWTLLGDILSTKQLIGAGIIFTATILAIWAPSKSDNQRISPNTVALGIVSALLLAVGLVCERAMLNHMDVGGVFLVAWGGQTISMLVLAAFSYSKVAIKAFYKQEVWQAARMGLANGFCGLFYVYAIYASRNISLVNSLFAVSLPLTVLGAHFFLKERDNSKLMWLSVLLSTGGVLAMTL